MPDKNLSALKAVYTQWAQGNFATPDIFDPDVEIVWAAEMPDIQRSARGISEMTKSLRDWLAPWENFSWTADEYIAVEDGFLVLFTGRGHGKGSTVEIEAPGAHLWTFREGKAVRLEGFFDQDEGRRAAGL
jgi:ketosteroid isomerase-like protein